MYTSVATEVFFIKIDGVLRSGAALFFQLKINYTKQNHQFAAQLF